MNPRHAFPRRRDHMRMPPGFRLWFAFVACLILAIWAAVGFGLYSVVTDPEGTGRFAGRIIGGGRR